MRLPYWLLKLLPMWDYICPRCRREVKPNSYKCPYCGECFPFPLKVPPKCLKNSETLEAYVHKHVFPLVSASQRKYLAQFFTTLFSDGFESGDFSAWTGTNVGSGQLLEVQSSVVHHGSYAMHAKVTTDSRNAYCYKSFTSSANPIFARAYVRFPVFPSKFFRFLVFKNASGSTVWALAINPSGGSYYVNIERYFPGYYTASLTSFTPSVDTWYCFEVEFYKAASGGYYKVYVDGVDRTPSGFSSLDTSGSGDFG